MDKHNFNSQTDKTQTMPGVQPQRDSLDATEQIAGAVLGKLLARGYLPKLILKNEGMRLIHEDIAAAIRDTLPDMDMTELQRIAGN